MPTNYSIHIKAIFKGLNGSCGYQTHTEYKLSLRHESGSNIKIVRVKDGFADGGECEYESMLTFLDNWDCIRAK